MKVKPINNKTAYPYLLDIHYAGRIPSISYAFGLFDGEKLIGVCTYGTPSSAPLKRGVCGDKYGDDFYLAPRPRKHRYVYFIGSKTQKKHYLKALNYKTEQYPKTPA